MASKLLTILLILPAIYAKIEISIVASENEARRAVDLAGSNVDIISDKERNTFQLNDEILKNAVAKYFGKRPDDVYVRSPTPWGDLYKSYNWQQVTRTLTPQSAKILEVRSQPTVLQTNEFSNNSTKPAIFKANIQQSVENTISSSWERNYDLTVGQDIEYGIDIEVASVSGKTSFSYTSRWGEGVSKSESVTVGSTSGVEISLQPNQKVTAELYAMRGFMMIQVDYEATLSGSLAVNYDNVYKGHHFWSLGVNEVMSAAGLERTKKSREIIKLGYYSDSKVVIKDTRTKSVLYTAPLKLEY